MSSSNKSKSRSTGQPRSAGNEPVTHFKVSFTPSERSAKPKKKITRKVHSLTSKGKMPPVLHRNPPNSQSNRGNDKSMSDSVAIFQSENPHFRDLNKIKAIKAAEQNKEGKVQGLIDFYNKAASKKGGKKTRKYKKSKKSKTRSKRC